MNLKLGPVKLNRSIGWNIARQTMKITQVIENGAGCYPWREVFVWWPWATTITGKRIWWERVFKRRVWVVWGSGFHMEPEVQYATMFELLACQDQDYFNMK